MKKLHILTLAIAAALVSTLALAQTAAPRTHAKPDANGDGVITKEEAAKFPRLAEKFAQLDKNKDGKLSGEELPMHRTGMRAACVASMAACARWIPTATAASAAPRCRPARAAWTSVSRRWT